MAFFRNYGTAFAISAYGELFVVGQYNPHHSSWVAGNAGSANLQNAVKEAAAASLTQFPSQTDALQAILNFLGIEYNDDADFDELKNEYLPAGISLHCV